MNIKFHQLIFDIEYLENYAADAFVVTEYNRDAFEALKCNQIGYKPFPNILILNGGRLSGKTYLCKMWQANLQNTKNLNEIIPLRLAYDALIYDERYIDNNQSNIGSNQVNIDSGQMYKVLEHIKKSNCFLENINLIEDESLFYILENMINGMHQYVLTTSTWPLEVKIQDLLSRLNSIKRINILSPDLISLKMAIVNYFDNKNINVSLNTLNYIAYRMPSDFERVHSILEDINHQSLIKKINISISFLQKFYLDNLNLKENISI